MGETGRVGRAGLTRRASCRRGRRRRERSALAANPLLARAIAGATPGRRVAVLGGGMAGLTAAHELAERGFQVDVYEPVALGGKARSIGVPGTARGRAQAAARRARLPLLPRLLPPRPRLDAADPRRQATRTASGTTSSTPTRASSVRAERPRRRAALRACVPDPAEALTPARACSASSSRRS